eukprot:TRINITY_DN1918_c0_g1_i1.p1 TRINITY_DN1918_c0_g1~~TRINITY_DN1918_c0_g1_i1.p1  ORF type:complete len:250 (+),score=59.63 TRINITY_DN1918_c0_g1_i1:70-819(+)
MSSEQKPIELYSTATTNGQKIHIFLEEAGIPYNAHTINIRAGEQFTPEFLKINPNNKVPAIFDPNTNQTVFESGAILLYLSERTGKFLAPLTDLKNRYEAIEWVFWQMGGLGPMLGQYAHFNIFAKEKIPYAIERYGNESKRLINVLNYALEGKEYLAGEYSIADIAIYPWVAGFFKFYPDTVETFPNVKAYADRIGERPAVQKGMSICKVEELPDPKSFGTFIKPEGWEEINIFDSSTHLQYLNNLKK